MKKIAVILMTVIFMTVNVVNVYAETNQEYPAESKTIRTGNYIELWSYSGTSKSPKLWFTSSTDIKIYGIKNELGKIKNLTVYNKTTNQKYIINYSSQQWYYSGGKWEKYTLQNVSGDTVYNSSTDYCEIVSTNMIIYDATDGVTPIYTPPPINSTLPDEYFQITSPWRVGYQTIDKSILFKVSYKLPLPSGDINNLSFNWKDSEQKLLSENINIESVQRDTYNSRYVINNGYVEGSEAIIVKFKQYFVGSFNFIVGCTDKDNNTYYAASRTFEIVAYTDANQDGLDDTTGEELNLPDNSSNTGPERENFPEGIAGDVQFGFARLLYIITTPFRWIFSIIQNMLDWLTSAESWIGKLNQFFGAIFGFLPLEIRQGIITMVSVVILFSVFRIFRG